MADVIYFDSNLLVYWAAGRSGSQEPRDRQSTANVEHIVKGNSALYLSPLTLVEFNSVLYKLVRQKQGPYSQIDSTAAASAEQQLMKWIADKRIVVPQLGQRAFEVGMSYVASATRQHGRRVYAWDAIHLFEVCRLARQLDTRVVLATSDSDFASLLEIFPEFNTYVELRDFAQAGHDSQ